MDNNDEQDYLNKWLNSSLTMENNQKKPFVILSYATSLDGSITAERGKPSSLSCRKSAEAVHEIRAFCDAIMVGIGTVISDNPLLSVRLVEGNNPVPVIIDTALRTPLTSQLLEGEHNPFIFCGTDPDKTKRKELEKKGAVVVESEDAEKGLSLIYVLHHLYDLGIRFLMVEGDGEIICSFLEQKLWDKLAITITPQILGGYSLPGSQNICSQIKFKSAEWLSSGTDQICLIDRESI
jgi:riboflavin-specific deaminase-like protein